jgi:hypothetical protein
MKGDNGTMQIGLMSIDGSNLRQLTRTDDDYTRPTFSPDGRYLAFIRGLKSPSCVVIVEIQTGEETIIANDACCQPGVGRSNFKIGRGSAVILGSHLVGQF